MTRRSPTEIGNDLREWLSVNRITGQRLADAINSEKPIDSYVTQSWISRICNGRFKRNSRQVEAVLTYTGIPIEKNIVRDPEGLSIIEAAVGEIWDGSTDSARAIARVLRSAGAFALRGRSTGL